MGQPHYQAINQSPYTQNTYYTVTKEDIEFMKSAKSLLSDIAKGDGIEQEQKEKARKLIARLTVARL